MGIKAALLCCCIGICTEFEQLTWFMLKSFASCLSVSLIALLYDTHLVPSWGRAASEEHTVQGHRNQHDYKAVTKGRVRGMSSTLHYYVRVHLPQACTVSPKTGQLLDPYKLMWVQTPLVLTRLIYRWVRINDLEYNFHYAQSGVRRDLWYDGLVCCMC